MEDPIIHGDVAIRTRGRMRNWDRLPENLQQDLHLIRSLRNQNPPLKVGDAARVRMESRKDGNTSAGVGMSCHLLVGGFT